MCNLETEGTKYICGHYIITKKLCKHDCWNPRCIHSASHPNPCHNCQCDRYLGPDLKETVTASSRDFCPECKPWYRGPLGELMRR
ncbi:hypothetical protein OBBRIDRAFT_283706 [Obba rivulosa]|uniref:Uncharacterized protein n=1 Tax=Obba rivulosa TaxID=1052685 RepID=A0A8E2DHF8_9APHY|nr:hypothetical protein OBBRIDRAFT_283706 [Obba rivulosa]